MNSSSIVTIVVAGVLVLIGTGVLIFSFTNRPVSEEGAVMEEPKNSASFPDFDTFEENGGVTSNSGSNNSLADDEALIRESNFYDADEDYVADNIYDNTSPSLSDTDEEDGLSDTNTASEEREELREEVPRPQALPQPIQETLAETQEQVDEELAQTVSNYLGKIEIKGSSGAKKKDVDEEHIVLTADSRNEGVIDVTGWKFRSAVSGKEVVIKEAERLFVSGSSVPKERILMYPKDKVTFVTGDSPIGYSFKLNICTGYLNQFNDFYPSVSTNCPVPENEILFWNGDQSIFLDNECMDFVDRMKKCRIIVDPYPPTVTPNCQQAISDNIGYNICINRHKNEPDFYLQDQRVYFERSSKMWREDREIIELIDEAGFVVDFIEY